MLSCPLCSASGRFEYFYHSKFSRQIYHCSRCDLRFVARENCLNFEEQKSCYGQHKNDKKTPGYTKFLNRLILPLIERNMQSKSGLDFGSGPYPMLQELMIEQGFSRVEIYDPIYSSDSFVFNNTYKFITCCEVVEHFLDPLESWKTMISLLEKNGRLIISTGIFDEKLSFADWFYIQDITHINFYTEKSFIYIADFFNLKLESIKDDLIILEKK